MKSDMENRDWLNEFPELKKVNSNNPFTVPAGYFNELAERTATLHNLRHLTVEHGGFTFPEGYFDELSGNIQSRIIVAGAINVEHTGFETPENYFDELSSNIQSRISIEELAGSEQEAGFEVPQSYFEELQQNISARIAVEEMLETGQDAFEVPAGYFDKLNAAILSKTVEAEEEVTLVAEEETKVVSLPAQRKTIVRRLMASGIYKYAAAACVVIVAGVSFLIGSTNSQPAHQKTFLHEKLADIPVTEIKSYIEQDIDAGEAQVVLSAAEQKSNAPTDQEILDYMESEL